MLAGERASWAAAGRDMGTRWGQAPAMALEVAELAPSLPVPPVSLLSPQCTPRCATPGGCLPPLPLSLGDVAGQGVYQPCCYLLPSPVLPACAKDGLSTRW